MNCCGPAAMIAMGVLWLLAIAALLLGIAALIKYLRSVPGHTRSWSEKRQDSDETRM